MMHEGQWHDGWFQYEHMWGMWFWPVVIVGAIALIIYFVAKATSGPRKK